MHPKTVLERHGLHPKKSLGQNFIFDDHVLAAIVAIAQLQADDNVLEIGAGLGALTLHLARAAGQVLAVELDDRLLPILQHELRHTPNVRLLHGDILEQSPAEWFGFAAYRVVANVPYYITGAILRHLFTVSPRPESVTLTVQQEVAQRLVAKPGDMSLLAVSVQCFGVLEVSRTIKAGAFWPRPEVDSAVVHIRLRRPALIAPEEEQPFFRLVRAGFSQKRKQLQNNLRELGLPRETIAAATAAAGIDGSRRAETLSLDEWVTLLRSLP